jgi:vesicle transport protein SEC22
LKKLNPRSTSKMSIESNPYVFQYVLCCYSCYLFIYLLSSYLIDNGICYLTLTERTYPKRLAFLFLEEICKDFEADLKAEYGDEWLRTVETVGRQYAFIKFGKFFDRFTRFDFTESFISQIE